MEFTNELDYTYNFDKSKLNNFIKSARKWSEKQFVEEYLYLNDIELITFVNIINKGDIISIGRLVKDDNDKNVYKNSIQLFSPYKTVIANKNYGSNTWGFILDNTKELQDEAKLLYNQNKTNKKPKFNSKEKTTTCYHASPNKFNHFRYGQNKTSGQIGADNGFFFFNNIKFAKYYASAIKDYNGIAYVYECDIRMANTMTVKGEQIGVSWGRDGFLESSKYEGYNTVIIKDADTGIGISDEIIVFDDDDIKINKIIKI